MDVTMQGKDLLIIEDNAQVRAFLADSSEQTTCFDNILQACSFETGQLAIKTSANLGLVFCDIGLPDGDGMDLVRQAIARSIPTVVVSEMGDEDTVISAIEYGAIGYLHKELDSSQIVTAIQQVLDGESPLSPSIASHILRRLRHRKSRKATPARANNAISNTIDLTDREIEVLRLIAHGYQYDEVADLLNISVHTVGNHNRNIYRKLGVNSRAGAVYNAYKAGILRSSH